jgi:Protein of unknown function (DUF1064)
MAKGNCLRFPTAGCMPPSVRAAFERQYGVPQAQASPREQKPRRGKYNAERVVVDGIKFDSKHEAEIYVRLKLLQLAGEVKHFNRQVIFDLPGKTEYRLDFLVVYPGGRIEYWDAKGVETPMFRLKRRQVREIHGVEIRCV